MTFIRFWNVIYILAVMLSLYLRFIDTFFDSIYVIGFNLIVILTLLTSWFCWEKNKKWGSFLLKVMAVFRLIVDICALSIIMGFVLSYVPLAPLWSLLLKLPTPIYLLISSVLIGIEVFYFKKISLKS